MATTLKIQRFIRYVRQGRTPEPVSCTAMDACTQQAYDALMAAQWIRVEEKEAGLPRHNWAQSGFSPNWDAAKYCGDYADGYQNGYATAVCYTLKMPADALTGTTAKIKTLSIPTYGDRYLADGCDISIKLSASLEAPVWGSSADDAVTGQLAVGTPSNTGSDTAAIITFDWSAAPKTSLAYLHITLRLTNYLSHRGAWIEGGAMLDGANIMVEFDRDVAEDGLETIAMSWPHANFGLHVIGCDMPLDANPYAPATAESINNAIAMSISAPGNDTFRSMVQPPFGDQPTWPAISIRGARLSGGTVEDAAFVESNLLRIDGTHILRFANTIHHEGRKAVGIRFINKIMDGIPDALHWRVTMWRRVAYPLTGETLGSGYICPYSVTFSSNLSLEQLSSLVLGGGDISYDVLKGDGTILDTVNLKFLGKIDGHGSTEVGQIVRFENPFTLGAWAGIVVVYYPLHFNTGVTLTGSSYNGTSMNGWGIEIIVE